MMKTLDHTPETRDEVIAEVHRHKDDIAAEHNYDLDVLLKDLRARQKLHAHLVSRVVAKDAHAGTDPPVARPMPE